RRTFEALLREQPSLVVIGERTDRYLNGQIPFAPGSPARRRELWRTGLRREVAALTRAGIRVVLIQPIPLARVVPLECAVVLVEHGGCSGSVPRGEVDRELAPARSVQRAALAGLAGATILDFEDAFCSASRCTTSRNGVNLYRDRSHLSVAGALTFEPRLRAAMRAALRS